VRSCAGPGASLDEASREAARLRRAGDIGGLGRRASDPSANIAAAAIRELAPFGSKALPYYEHGLRHPQPEVRETTAVSVGRAGRVDVDAVPRFAELLAPAAQKDPSPNVRAAAVAALGDMWAAEQMDALVAAMEDRAPLVRKRAAVAVDRLCGMKYFQLPGDSTEERKRKIATFRQGWAENTEKRVAFIVTRRKAVAGTISNRELKRRSEQQ
jgi:HEAT repeat protein